jgi:hypothetical protein
MDLFSTFVNWQTGLLCLGVFVFTYAIRRIVETVWLAAPTNRYYAGIFLPLGAIGTGMVLGLLSKKFPWPTPLLTSVLARVMYGGICGLASGWVYVHFRKFIKELGGKDKDSTPPAASVAAPAEIPIPKDPEPPEPPKG